MCKRPFDTFLVEQFSAWAQRHATPGSRYQFRSPDSTNAESLHAALIDEAGGHVQLGKVALPYLFCGGARVIPVLQNPGAAQSYSENYISFLRDEISRQGEPLKDCALLIIHNSLLDTLINNADDLGAGGSVWSRGYVKRSLEQLINQKLGAQRKVSECLLNYQFDVLCEEDATVFGFAPLYHALQDGQLRFNELELLPDPFITEASVTDETLIRKRLDENRQLYRQILSEVEEYPNSLQLRLKDRFTEGFIKETFPKEDLEHWQSVDFQRFRDDEKKSSKPALIYEKSVLDPSSASLIDRAQNERAAGQRKRHLLLLADPTVDEIELRISFEGSDLQNGEVRQEVPSELEPSLDVSRSGKRSFIKLRIKVSAQPAFFKLSTSRDRAAEKYEFHCLLLRKGWFYVGGFRNYYLVDTKQQQLRLETDAEALQIGEGGGESFVVTAPGETVNGLIYSSVDFSQLANESDKVEFRLDCYGRHLDFFVKSEPASDRLGVPLLLDGDRGAHLFDDEYNGQYNPRGRVSLDNREYEVVAERHMFLRREALFVEQRVVGSSDTGELISLKALREADSELADSYENLFAYLDATGTLPSLASWGPSFRHVVRGVVESSLAYLGSVKHDTVLTQYQRLVMHVGLYTDEGTEYLSPYHPLVLAYYLYLAEAAAGEKSVRSFAHLPKVTLDRLTPRGLLPFVYDELHGFAHVQSVPHNAFWLKLVPREDSSYEFVRKLIKEKLLEFKNAFSALFTVHEESELILNVVNGLDASEVLYGIVEYFKHALNRGDAKPTPIHINFYDETLRFNAFDGFSEAVDAADMRRQLGMDKGVDKSVADAVIDALRTRMSYSKFSHSDSPDGYLYAHITFVRDEERVDRQFVRVNASLSGVAANGLITGEASENKGGAYYTAFGLRGIDTEARPHLQLAELYGSLWMPARLPSATYTGSNAVAIAVNEEFRTLLQRCYSSSIWTTLIDPKVTLDFFDTQDGVVLIHYSDQYTSSASYDAVTVTRELELYRNVLESTTGEHRTGLINEFNAFNGQWLLHMLTASSTERKGIQGVIGAYKFASTLVLQADITWVPFSVAELVRVAANSGLKLTGSEFSRVVQGYRSGVISDDVLLVGLKDQRLYLLPVEVKAGVRPDYDKAEKQARELKRYLTEDLLTPRTLAGRLYRALFARQLFIQIEKYRLYNVFNAEYFDKIRAQREAWLAGDYSVDEVSDYPAGFVVAFVENDACFEPSYVESGDILRIELPFGLLNDIVARPLQELNNLINENNLCNVPSKYILEGTIHSFPPVSSGASVEKSDSSPANLEPFEEDPEKPSGADALTPLVKKMPATTYSGLVEGSLRILFGHDVLRNQPIYWEPTNTSKVFNTNTGIIGTMGTGKTQFTKSLVTQLVQNFSHNVGGKSIGVLVFDYKADYIKEDFVAATGARVFDLHRLPFNPFALHGDKPMLPVHTANLFRSTIGKAYNLGNRQQNKIRTLVLEAYSRAGIHPSDASTWDRPAPTLQDVWELYQEQDNVEQDSLYAVLDDLVTFQIFEPETEKTRSLYDLIDGVNVINLSGYDSLIQNLVVAITLDIFYSQMHQSGSSAQEGDYRQITKMVLVDEADNFMSQGFDSIKKILKEGREFGVGTILSTQEMTHFKSAEVDYSSYILTWVVHRVSQIKSQDLKAVFNPEDKATEDRLSAEVRSLGKHVSLLVDGAKRVSKIQDMPFYKIV
ncbi:DNA phosphorothioation-dependent restriction protein DptH [Halomonas sp. LR5S20]|uniref:DNA phosphorothioation-dependent restriction protein DptH n=2 Tax=Halomonas rhizosphaerae TaxID=3043296 RepID=A0ABT6V7L5_9GAMM|nr:DNA phosphorothioation-dependent restriction protein DptH [Halomonas rhizosphaerae]